jgi:hypothetical protein
MTGLTISIFAPKSPPTVSSPDTVYTGAINTRSNFILCVPTFLEVSFPTDHSSRILTDPQEWSQLPERVNELQKFDAIVSHIIIKHFFLLSHNYMLSFSVVDQYRKMSGTCCTVKEYTCIRSTERKFIRRTGFTQLDIYSELNLGA